MVWRPNRTGAKKFSPCPKAAVKLMQQFLQVLCYAMQSVRIITVLFQPVQMLQQYFIVIYIQYPKSPN